MRVIFLMTTPNNQIKNIFFYKFVKEIIAHDDKCPKNNFENKRPNKKFQWKQLNE